MTKRNFNKLAALYAAVVLAGSTAVTMLFWPDQNSDDGRKQLLQATGPTGLPASVTFTVNKGMLKAPLGKKEIDGVLQQVADQQFALYPAYDTKKLDLNVSGGRVSIFPPDKLVKEETSTGPIMCATRSFNLTDSYGALKTAGNITFCAPFSAKALAVGVSQLR